MSNPISKNDPLDEYDPPDDMYKKIATQIDDEERLWAIFTEMREYTEYAMVPLLDNMKFENLSDFLTPSRVKIF